MTEGSAARRGRRSGWLPWDTPELVLLLLGLAGLGATLGLNLLQAQLVHLTRWQSIALYTAGAVLAGAGLVLKLAKDGRQARRAWAQTVRGLLAVGLTPKGRLPTVHEVDSYGAVGVSRSRYSATHQDPYVGRRDVDDRNLDDRDVDGRLDQLLADQPLVLVVGKSLAGKSRTALQAVRRALPEAELPQPRGRRARPAPRSGPAAAPWFGPGGGLVG